MDELRIVGWTDFDDVYPTISLEQDAFEHVIELIQDDICANNYVIYGDNHQNSITGVPVFSNGTCFRASMRAWGQIMASAQSQLTGENYSYMDFYMSHGADYEIPDFEELDVEPAQIENSVPGYITIEDAEMISQSQAMGMPFLTTDKVLQALA